MSYYRPSQTVGMSRGSGRGYSSGRGSSSYRGGGGGGGRGGSSWNDRGGSRGSFSSSRGGNRFSSWSNSSFESRTRYNTSSGSGDRYSSTPRGRPDDSSYRRSYRSDGPTYSSGREASTRSPDRKRLRIEAGSSRRSHEGGYGASDGYGGGSSGRYESAPNSYGSERRSAFNDDRRATFRQRDEGARLSPRTSFRGRTGPRSGRARPLALRDIAPRRRIIDNSTYIRKRGLSGDFFRRVRISRLRSANSRRSIKKGRSSEKDVSDKEEENWDDDVNDDDTGAAAAKKSKEDADSSKQSDDRKSSPDKKSPKKDKDKDKEDGSGAEGEDGGDTAADEDRDQDDKKSTASDDDNRARSKYTGRPFIPLTCPHCGYKCVRFREYSMHLYSGRHIMAMRKVSLKQKSLLARARQAQRSAQRELEKNDDALAPRTNFCPLCKLNYRQLKSKHQMSEAHRNMKKFLMPYCRVCHLTFKSPMLYENHLCSLDHIKKKAHEVSNGDKHGSDKEGDSPAEEELENFTTIDSVGDVDEEEGEPKKISKPSSESLESSSKPTEAINVGVEHVKKVEVYYCDLCRTYLSRHEEEERALRQHCRGRVHLRRYVRYKEDKDLRRQAERIHRKTQEAKEAKEKEKEQSQGKGDEKEKEDAETEKQEKDTNDEDATDDKMWADVDKDLGEILAEVHNDQNGKSSDEEDDGGRYDRFRYSDKPDGKEDLDKTDPDVKEENEEKEEGEVNAEEEEEEEEKNEEKVEEEEK